MNDILIQQPQAAKALSLSCSSCSMASEPKPATCKPWASAWPMGIRMPGW